MNAQSQSGTPSRKSQAIVDDLLNRAHRGTASGRCPASDTRINFNLRGNAGRGLRITEGLLESFRPALPVTPEQARGLALVRSAREARANAALARRRAESPWELTDKD